MTTTCKLICFFIKHTDKLILCYASDCNISINQFISIAGSWPMRKRTIQIYNYQKLKRSVCHLLTVCEQLNIPLLKKTNNNIITATETMPQRVDQVSNHCIKCCHIKRYKKFRCSPHLRSLSHNLDASL